MKFPAGTRPEDRFKHVVHLLVQLIEDGLRDEYVRRKAVEIVNRAGIRGHDELGEIRAITVGSTQCGLSEGPHKRGILPNSRRLIKDIRRSAADCDDFVIVERCLIARFCCRMYR